MGGDREVWWGFVDALAHKVSVGNMSWSGEERAFVVESYFKNGDSVVATQRAFRRHFNLRPLDSVPGRNTIIRWVAAFRATGSTLKQKPPGRPRSIRTPENLERLRQGVQRSPRRSAMKQAAALQISDRSVRRMLHLDLKFHPYKMAFVHTIQNGDYQRRVDASQTLLQNVPKNSILLTSDEAHFHLSGYVNKQNYRYWAPENPRELHQTPLHSQRVTVWAMVAAFGVWEPYFFEENGRAVTVTSARYVQMLQTFVQPKLQQLNGEVWFQQDGATAHTARASMSVLNQMFPGRIISQRGDLPWPPRSPDLAPCDFFLWGYLKEKVYTNRPQTTDALKAAIRTEMARIPPEMTARVMQNFRNRLTRCIANDGRHLEDIIFHK